MAHAVWIVAAMTLGFAPDEGVILRETSGGTARVLIEMTAEGTSRYEPPSGSPKTTQATKPHPLKIESRLDFVERVLDREADGSAKRSARRVIEAAAAVAGERGGLHKLRPEVALLVADRRAEGVVVVSTGGPLSRWELELVQVPGDPLALGGLLSDRAVKVGEKWPVSLAAAKTLSEYDTVVTNGLEAKLDVLTEASATIRIGGSVKGSARGGDGEIRITGTLLFDRKANRIRKIELSRDETRKQGFVEWALDVKSRLLVEKTDGEATSALSDDALAALPKDNEPQRERLLLESPDARYTIEHDRDWHVMYESPKQVVLKRIDKTGMVAQCNLAVGPKVGKGGHQNLDEFRNDIKKALGARFVAIAEEGEVDGLPSGGFRYKIGVSGREGTRDVIWYYYLIASPEGEQLLATFTLDAASLERFGAEDEALIGALEWKAAGR